MATESSKSQADRMLKNRGTTVTLRNMDDANSKSAYGREEKTVSETDIPAFVEESGRERMVVGYQGEERTLDVSIYVGNQRDIHDGQSEMPSEFDMNGITYQVIVTKQKNENGFIRCYCRRNR